LIAMGLQLISDSYLDVLARKAGEAGLAFERKMVDGKHYKVLVEDALASDYDLVVMGALGMGAVKDSQLGSVTERFIRKVPKDTLIVRNTDALRDQQGAIVVCLDGSPQSFNGLRLGISLAKALARSVRAVAVYDPYLHYAMFNGIVGVLNEKASKIFRFKEQEQLHEEIIDTGLAKIYQSHLEIGRKLAAEESVAWTEEAEARMERVPPQVKGVARTALLRYAIEQGHTVITNKVIEEAMAIFMPTRMAEKMQILAEDLAVAKLRAEQQAATA